jgi:hypothetical protein
MGRPPAYSVMRGRMDLSGRVVARNGEMPPFPVNTAGTQKARKGRRYEGKFKSKKQIPSRRGVRDANGARLRKALCRDDSNDGRATMQGASCFGGGADFFDVIGGEIVLGGAV